MEACKPECKHWFDKLSRCESALKSMKNADPEMSCMYPLRDWVTCLEGCVRTLNNPLGAAQDPETPRGQREGIPLLNAYYTALSGSEEHVLVLGLVHDVPRLFHVDALGG